jgi:hypothetical protein
MTPQTTYYIVAALTFGAAQIGAARAGAAQNPVDAPTFDWGGQIPAGSTLHIVSVDGNIRVTASSNDQAQVHGERRGVMSGRRALLFQVVRNGSDVTVCAYHPGDSCDYDGTHDHGWHDHDGIHFGDPPRADFTVQLPAGVKLATHTADGDIDVQHAGADVSAHSGDGSIHIAGAAGTVNAHSGDGDVSIEGAQGNITAHTGDGKIFVATASGDVEATSGDGDVEARIDASRSLHSLRLHSGDGTVTVFLPSNFAGDIEANTGDGSVDSDFPLELSGRMNPHHVHATIGGGGSAHIDVSTGDGDVHLRKG